jgi:hypothetical protein
MPNWQVSVSSCSRYLTTGPPAPRLSESGWGQTQKSLPAIGRSASPSGTDIICRTCEVRKVPLPDIASRPLEPMAEMQHTSKIDYTGNVKAGERD